VWTALAMIRPLPQTLVYNQEGKLLAMPVVRRSKADSSMTDRYGYSDYENTRLTAMSYLTESIASPLEYADLDNVPLSESQQNRAAWLGVILQSLSPDLARLNKVTEVSKNGNVGGIVSFVYPDSPAQRAGIEPGMVLLRIHSASNPRPVNIDVDEQMSQYSASFPWDRLDEVPAEYMNELPVPWPAAKNEISEILQGIGFGREYTVEAYKDGAKLDLKLTVEECPTYYDSAPRYKSSDTGLTVRNLTFEVKRYMQLTEQDPGVIVSGIEQGSKADVANIKIFEVITHINDKPIMTVDDFRDATEQDGELRFAIKRMSKGRIVNISR
jgi:serine protease Do